jgi:hypothetical protein
LARPARQATRRTFGAGVHRLAVAAARLERRKAHWLTTPQAWESFGYHAGDVPQVIEQVRERLAQADELTRKLLQPAYSALNERATTFSAALPEMKIALATSRTPRLARRLRRRGGGKHAQTSQIRTVRVMITLKLASRGAEDLR